MTTGLTFIIILVLSLLVGPALEAFRRGRMHLAAEMKETKARRIKNAAQTIALANRHADTIKEVAAVYGIDGNEAHLDTNTLVKYRNKWRQQVDEETVNKVQSTVLAYPPTLAVTEREVQASSHRITRLVAISQLVVVEGERIAQATVKGGERDDEESNNQSLKAREVAVAC